MILKRESALIGTLINYTTMAKKNCNSNKFSVEIFRRESFILTMNIKEKVYLMNNFILKFLSIVLKH